MNTISKGNLIDIVAEKTGVKKADTKAVIDATVEQIKTELVAGNKVALAAFGTFEVRTRAERVGRNPRSGEEMVVPASKNVGFKAGSALKAALNA